MSIADNKKTFGNRKGWNICESVRETRRERECSIVREKSLGSDQSKAIVAHIQTETSSYSPSKEHNTPGREEEGNSGEIDVKN